MNQLLVGRRQSAFFRYQEYFPISMQTVLMAALRLTLGERIELDYRFN